jgi:hypothetical protein
MIVLVILTIWISCNSAIKNPSSYVELIKNQNLLVFSPDATIGEVFDVVSKGTVVWKAEPMPANDSEYRYRNIHKTSVLVEATWPVDTGPIYGNRKIELKVQFSVKKDKTEFAIYRTAINGEYENDAATISTTQSIGGEYIMALRAIAAEKEKNKKEKWETEAAPYIELIKKSYSSIYDDTYENAFKLIFDRNDRKVEWGCQKLNFSGEEYIGKNLYLVTAICPVEGDLWQGWGPNIKQQILIGFLAGEDLAKIKKNTWKQGDIYSISSASELTAVEKLDSSKEDDNIKLKELEDYMYRLYKEKSGKKIKPSLLEIERNEAAPYIESVNKAYSKTYNDTYENFYTILTESKGPLAWSAYNLRGNNSLVDKDLLTIINTPENINKKFFIAEIKIWFKPKDITISFFAGNEWAKATNNTIINGDIYKVKEEYIDLYMNKPEDVKKWIELYNSMVYIYWMNSHKSYNQLAPRATDLKDAK